VRTDSHKLAGIRQNSGKFLHSGNQPVAGQHLAANSSIKIDPVFRLLETHEISGLKPISFLILNPKSAVYRRKALFFFETRIWLVA
jgi:hypothetical protein